MKRLVTAMLALWLAPATLVFAQSGANVPQPDMSQVPPAIGYEAWLPPPPPDLEQRLNPPATRWWVDGEFIYWHFPDPRINAPLVTMRPGALGLNPEVVFGARSFSMDPASGGRLRGGWWVDGDHNLGLEASGFLTEVVAKTRSVASDTTGDPDLDRQLVDVRSGQAVTLPISISNQLIGRIDIAATSQLGGGEVQGILKLYQNDCFRLELLSGFQILELKEQILIDQTSRGLPFAVFPTGAFGLVGGQPTFQIADHFATRNQFDGGFIGAKAEVHAGPLFFSLTGKAAVGNTSQQIETQGLTTFLPGGPDPGMVGMPALVVLAGNGQAVPGGALVTADNMGRFTRNRITFGSELEATGSVAITSCCRLSVGYDLMYWSNVVRPGDQITNVVNLSQVPLSPFYGAPPGPVHATIPFNGNSFLLQGLHLGLELDF
jgi:Putative beta barrel porin-7 (BBP7)